MFLPKKFDFEFISVLRSRIQKSPISLRLFLALCFNIVFAKTVYAAANTDEVTRLNAYAIGLLGLVTIGLAIYLLVVMFQPQRF